MNNTNDLIIRSALKKQLIARYNVDPKVRIIEELAVRHGAARIDLVVINAIMCGYEIKSDRDTLERLPEQIEEFNAIFDKITLVVGKHHLYQALYIIPDWWGIQIAKINSIGQVVLQSIREPENNSRQDKISIARLLWREEALQILEEHGKAAGVRSKSREFIYRRLAEVLETDLLKEKVRNTLSFIREDWRFGLTPLSDGG